VDQATSLGERLRGEGIEAVITSELLRARHTAALVTKALGLPQLVNRLANEVRIGASMEGVLASVSQAALAHDPVNAFHVDGGESFSDVQERISLLISDISRSSPNTVLVVTHGWVLQAVRVLKGEISALEGALCYEMPGNCEVVELLLTP
jgi:broad specificity phosphatase PhoE